jgi:hypothetical protein
VQQAKLDIVLARLEDQATWYDGRAVQYQRRYKWLKGIEIVAAAAIPVLAGQRELAVVVAGLGALIVVLEGVQALNQYHGNWVSYRNTAERLRSERVLFEVGAGPYAWVEEPEVLLAERVESMLSTERHEWVRSRKASEKQVRSAVSGEGGDAGGG